MEERSVKNDAGETLRRATNSDIESIYLMSKGSGMRSWLREDFRSELTNPSATLLVTERDKKAIAYAHTRLITSNKLKNGRESGDFELLNIVVAESYRKEEVASRLLSHLFEEIALPFDEVCCFLEVRESNVGARKLYRKAGFNGIGVRKAYYSDPREDCLLLKRIWHIQK